MRPDLLVEGTAMHAGWSRDVGGGRLTVEAQQFVYSQCTHGEVGSMAAGLSTACVV